MKIVNLKQNVERKVSTKGEVQGPGQLGKYVGESRRAASVCVVRAQAVCLLERLAFLGPGARAAADRRQGHLRLVERRRREAHAYQLAFQARGLGREGRAFVT